jgi:glycosyltransferase involved in cell wall biosynthesis
MWSIVHMLTSYGVGGGERVALDLAIGQKARGHKVSVLSLEREPDGAMASEFAEAGIEVGRVGKHEGLDYGLIPKLALALRARAADIVHTHNPLPLIYGAPAARLLGISTIHTKHGINHGTRGQALLRRAAGRLVDAFVAVSETTASQALEQRDIAPIKLHTIPNGIRLDRYAPDPEARAAARVELGLGDAFVIGSVGRLDPLKNQVMLVRALASRLSSRLRLVIVGEGPCRGELEAEIAKLPDPRWVVLTGRRMDVPRLMPAFDLFALSSSTEGLPLVVLEAMAAGLPVASTAVGGIPTVIDVGVTGLLAPVDADALGAAIGELVADPVRAREMGQRGREVALRRYSSERMVDAYLALYAQALA